jgi:hypothetical protein
MIPEQQQGDFKLNSLRFVPPAPLDTTSLMKTVEAMAPYLDSVQHRVFLGNLE